MASNYVNGVPVNIALQQARVYRETLVALAQLVTSPSPGVANAVSFFLTEQPSDGDTITLHNDTDGSEEYTFRTVATSIAFEVQIGSDVDETLQNLTDVIIAQSSTWSATLAQSLDEINGGTGSVTEGLVVVIYRESPSSEGDNDRIYGSLTTQSYGVIVDYSPDQDYVRTTTEALPSSDPASANFGKGRDSTDLLPNERHSLLNEDQTWAWDADLDRWVLVSGESVSIVIRQYAVGVAVRDFVYQSGSNQVDRADASAVSTSRPLGCVRALDTPQSGYCEVQTFGDLDGFASLTPGKVYILSTDPGKIVAEDDTGNGTYPNAAGEVIQEVGTANTTSSMLVNSQRDFEVLS